MISYEIDYVMVYYVLKEKAVQETSFKRKVVSLGLLAFLFTFASITQLSGQCSGNVYDTGGPSGNYSNYENYTVTYTATAGKVMKLDFISFNVENGYDFLYIYDGPNTSSPLIATLTGTSLPPDYISSGTTITLRFTSDYSITRSGWNIARSCIDPPVLCYAVAQGSNGRLYSFQGSSNTYIGQIGLTEIETMTMNYDGSQVYAANNGTFGSLNLTTAAFTTIGTVGTGNGPLGPITMNDIDGMAINPTNGLIMASHRRSGNDVIFAINPITGQISQNYFGSGVDYLEVTGVNSDIDDLAFHPVTHELYALATISGSATNDEIVIIDQYTGAATLLSTLPTCDLEGLSFDNDGNLYGTSGFEECSPYLDDSAYLIDYSSSSGSVTLLTTFGYTDVESVACPVDAVPPCINVDQAGTIAANQTFCAGADPVAFTNVTAASAPSGTIEYQWYYSTITCSSPLNQDTNWIAIPGATGLTYDHGPLSVTTCFTRGAKVTTCPVFYKFSNILTVTVNDCICPSPTAVVSTVSASTDDAEEHTSNGSIDITSTDLEMVQESDVQIVGMRFNNINVPVGALIESAFIRFQADEANSEVTNLIIKGQKSINPPTFSTTTNNISSRPTTTASKNWTGLVPWTVGTHYETPDIDTVIQEIVDQAGWASGQSIVIIVSGTGKRVAESFNGGADAPRLTINYCMPEICDNGIDDDGDGLIDCADPDCENYTSGGTIGSDEANCGLFDPANITEISAPSGGEGGTLTYKWQVNTGGGWTDIPGATSSAYNPSTINVTTSYRRGASRFNCNYVYSNTVVKTVDTIPTVSITGVDELCIGDTTTLSPTSGGTWASSDPGIATVTNAGVVTAVSAGTATFTFTASGTGCVSAPTASITVHPTPTTSYTGPTPICVGASTTITPASGGTWISSDTLIAEITDGGVITGMSAGTANFTFTDTTTGCVSLASTNLTVHPNPTANAGVNQTICNGDTVTISASGTGNGPFTYAWNQGLGAGQNHTLVPPGSNATRTTVTYTVTVTDVNTCTATDPMDVIVYSLPSPVVSYTDETCEQGNGTITFTFINHPYHSNIKFSINGGASYVNVADNSGAYTFVGLVPGTYFLKTRWGGNECEVDLPPVTISPQSIPTVSISGSDTICITAQTTLSPSSGGTWVSNNPSIASVTNTGVVTGIAAGNATFTYTDTTTNCVSNPTLPITVVPCEICEDGIDNDGDGDIDEDCWELCTNSIDDNNNSLADCDDPACLPGSYVDLRFADPIITGSGMAKTARYENVGIANGTLVDMVASIVQQSDPSQDHSFSKVGGDDFDFGLYSPDRVLGRTVSTTVQFEFFEAGTSTPIAFDFRWFLGDIESTNIRTKSVIVYRGELSGYGLSTATPTSLTKQIYLDSIKFTGTQANTVFPSPEKFGVTLTYLNTSSFKINYRYFQKTNSGVSITESFTADGDGDNTTLEFCEEICGDGIDNDGDGDIDEDDADCLSDCHENVPVWFLDSDASDGNALHLIQFTNYDNASVSGTDYGRLNFRHPVTSSITDIGQAGDLIGFAINKQNGQAYFLSESEISGGPASSQALWTYNLEQAPGNVANIVFTLLGHINKPSGFPLENLTLDPISRKLYATDPRDASANTSTTTDDLYEIDLMALQTDPLTVSLPGFVGALAGAGQTNNYAEGLAFTSSGTLYTHDGTDQHIYRIDPSNGNIVAMEDNNAIGGISGSPDIETIFWDDFQQKLIAVDNAGKQFAHITLGMNGNNYALSSWAGMPGLNPSADFEASASYSLCGPSTLRLGNMVYIDANGDGNYDAGEGVSGVVVQLFREGETPGVIGPISRDTTDVNGRYLFTNITPGKYFVFIPANMFTQGKSLYNTYSKPGNGGDSGADDDVDENGIDSSDPWNSGIASPVIALFADTEATNGSGESGAYNTDDDSDDNNGDLTIDFGFDPENCIPADYTGPSSICIGETTNLEPTSGGVWTSLDPGIATVDNAGLVTSVTPGTVKFVFNKAGNYCLDTTDVSLTIHALPVVNVTGLDTICPGESSSLSPTSGGTWTSSNPGIAVIDNNGVVTGVSQGTATFTYTSDTTGCSSNASSSITIKARPIVSVVGPDSVCVGFNTFLSPASGGSWSSNNGAVASVTPTGVVTGVGGGSTTFVFTSDANGCSSNPTLPVEVNTIPTLSIDFNGSICLTDTSKLTAVVGNGVAPYSFNWTGPSSFSSTLQEISISENGNYYVTVTDAKGCTKNTQGFVYDRYDPFVATLSSEICEGESVNLSINSPTAVAYQWGANAGNSTDSFVIVNPLPPSETYVVTVTNDLGCTTTASATITVHTLPIVNVVGPDSICVDESTTLSPSSGGIWSSANPSVATVTNNGVVTGISAGAVTFIFTDTTTNCPSLPTANITIKPKPVVTISGDDELCIGETSDLSPSSGGTWISNNPAVATVDNSGLVTAVSAGTATFTFTNNTTTCTSEQTTALTVHPTPLISITGTDTICIGNTTSLSPTTGGLWTSSAPSVASINNSGVVTGVSAGFARFVFTQTSTTCSSDSSEWVRVEPTATITISGDLAYCIDDTAQLTASLPGGVWASNNPSVATIDANTGWVTAISPGSADITYTNNTSTCYNIPSATVTVHPKPTTNITGQDSICPGEMTTFSPTFGGSWSSINPAVATINNSGIVTAVSAGSTRFVFTANATGCPSDPSALVTVKPKPTISVVGPAAICPGDTTTVTPSSGGIWVSNDTTIATVTNAGIVVGVKGGTASLSFTSDTTTCTSNPFTGITIKSKPVVSVTGPTALCPGETTTVTPSSGGEWVSTDTLVASVTNTGVVTGLSQGTASFIFTDGISQCISDPSTLVLVKAKPVIAITGPDSLCVGFTSNMTPNSGGVWTSTNPAVASITSTGVITGLEDGDVRFYFTNSSSNCVSDTSSVVEVNDNPGVSIDFGGSICLTDTSELTAVVTGGNPMFNYQWNGPSGFNSTDQIINVSENGNYYITVTDSKGCSSSTQGFLYQRYEPFIFSLNTTICEGESVTLSVNSGTAVGYQWDSAAGNATSQSVTVFPAPPSTTYVVTVTNNIGCTTTASAEITVNLKPVVSISGDTAICEGSTTNLSPSSGGSWSSANPGIASVTNSGLVTGIGPGAVTFTFQDSTTLCSSNPTTNVTVEANTPVGISGVVDICQGGTDTLTADIETGIWSSSDANILSVQPPGIITAVNLGSATIYFNPVTDQCLSTGSHAVTVRAIPNPNVIGASVICEDENTLLVPTSGGTWSSHNPSVATVTNSGVVTGISDGFANFTFTSTYSCADSLNNSIEIVGKKPVALLGPSALCIGGNTQLSPQSGGLWVSSNNSVASVNSAGFVTANAAGVADFSFYESQNGCLSDSTIQITVNPKPTTAIAGNSTICVGDSTQLTPASGGTWVSDNPAIAIINNNGRVIGLSAGVARFTFTDAATGCVSNKSAPVTVSARPVIDLNGHTDICIGSTVSVLPSSGGTWTSSNPSVASVNSSGMVTGVSVGWVRLTFQSSSSGCSSSPSDTITVNPKPTVAFTGPTSICVGSTSSMSPSSGGSWSSSNSNIASISSSGVITGLQPGNVTFTFTSSDGLCVSNPSSSLTVVNRPIAQITGPNNICVGSQTILTPTSGGTWSSSNPSLASITNNGVVTALGAGSVTFTFTNSSTGCSSLASSPVTIYAKPTVSITGLPNICVGSTTTLSPSSGGSWVSSNSNIASVNSSGIVSGVSPGSANFTFTENATGCTSNPTSNVVVSAKPPVSITGPNNICVGTTTTLSPSSGGYWTSTNPSVASVSVNGIVTGVSQGISKFTFHSDGGCTSDNTNTVTVFAKPTITVNDSELCVGDSIYLSPASGGTWQSSNVVIATITNGGKVKGLTPGSAFFTYTDSNTGCTSNPSQDIDVNARPQISLNGSPNICIGSTTQLSPTTGGLWYSNNTSVANVNNSGVVTGIGAGTTNFYFVSLSTGCVSNNSPNVTVSAKPTATLTGNANLCEGETTTFSPSSGGTWTSNNPSVATINNSGIATALNQGIARFIFTNSQGCASNLSAPINVSPSPDIGIIGSPQMCVDGTAEIYPSSGGLWFSSNNFVATVADTGLVSAHNPGNASLTFVDTITGCTSENSIDIVVGQLPVVNLVGDSIVCAGYQSQVSSPSSGIWISSRPGVATVSNSGLITAKIPGMTSIEFIDATTGCSSGSNSVAIYVDKCLNHDFNVTKANVPIQGNLATNDTPPAGAQYSSVYTTILKPTGSNPTLNINPDGTYTFQATYPGKYVFDVQICVPPMITGCAKTQLEFTVLGNIISDNNPVNNPEFATVFANPDSQLDGDSIIIKNMANDRCVKTLGCDLDTLSLNILTPLSNGMQAIKPSGRMRFMSAAGFIGYDTIEYEVCADGSLACSASRFYLTVNHPTARNSLAAPDDFIFTMAGTPVAGNVLANDSDPEGDNLTVQAVGSPSVPVPAVGGEYYIDANGNFTFTPDPEFEGSTEIIYTVCDDNAQPVCADATLHILVFGDMQLSMRVYLEGALMNNGNATSPTGRPLMRDNLRVNPFDGKNYIPLQDPYSGYVGLIDLSASFTHVGPGILTTNTEITDSAAVFTVDNHNAIVDWVFIELRDKNDMYSTIATRSALVQRDGDIVDLDGVSGVRFDGIGIDSFYVVVKHRSHLGAMSMKVSNSDLIDFTNPNRVFYDFGYDSQSGMDYTGRAQNANVKSGYLALWAGDFDANGKVKFTNPGDDQNILFFEVLVHPENPTASANFDYAYGYMQGDFDMNGKSKYTNPNDDKNLLFGEVLLYPLNSSLFDNFNFFIEQIPRP